MKLSFGLLGFIAIALGILTAAAIRVNSLYWLLSGLAVITLGLIVFIRKRQLPGWIIFFCFLSCGGFLFGSSRAGYLTELKINRHYDGNIVVLDGAQLERAVPARYGYRFSFRIKPAKLKRPVGRISVTSRFPLPSGWYGKSVRIKGRFKAVAGIESTFPGVFEKRRISGMLSITDRPRPLKGFGLPRPYLWANRIREILIAQGTKVLKPLNAGLLHGMVFNDRINDSSESDVVTDMRRTGTIHLLSVSGLHVGFIVIGLNFLLGLFRFPKKWRLIPLTITVWFYILMTGMDPPVLRAGIMMLLFFLGERLETGDDNLNRLSLAALLLVLVNPYSLFEIGFQLSFLATLGIVWIYPLFKEYFPLKPRLPAGLPFLKPAWEGILVSLGAQSLVIPIIIIYFQMISWSSPLVNLLLFIPAEVIVVGGLIGEAIGALIPLLGQIILTGVGWTLDLTRFILDFFGSRSWSFSWVPSWPWPWIAGYYLGLVLLLDWLRPNRLTGKRAINRGTLLVVILVILNIIIWPCFLNKRDKDYFRLSCLDVGQGDAIFIKTPDGFTALIDGGDQGKGQNRVLPFLRQTCVRQLNLVVVSHGHQDHLGGLAEVLAEVPANELIMPPQTNHDIQKFLRQPAIGKLKRSYGSNGRSLILGKSATARIFYVSDPESENDQSLVILIQYGKNKMLLTGDLGLKSEAILIRKYPVLMQASVLKVAHHGSNQATGLPFLTQVRPKLVVISVGAGNRFGHPGRKTMNRLNSLGIRTYRTDRDGRIDVKVYRERLMVATQK
jgi:competence protein ComEC